MTSAFAKPPTQLEIDISSVFGGYLEKSPHKLWSWIKQHAISKIAIHIGDSWLVPMPLTPQGQIPLWDLSLWNSVHRGKEIKYCKITLHPSFHQLNHTVTSLTVTVMSRWENDETYKSYHENWRSDICHCAILVKTHCDCENSINASGSTCEASNGCFIDL